MAGESTFGKEAKEGFGLGFEAQFLSVPKACQGDYSPVHYAKDNSRFPKPDHDKE